MMTSCPSYSKGYRKEDLGLQLFLGKNETPYLKNNESKEGMGYGISGSTLA
jgi:hypothetical protein